MKKKMENQLRQWSNELAVNKMGKLFGRSKLLSLSGPLMWKFIRNLMPPMTP